MPRAAGHLSPAACQLRPRAVERVVRGSWDLMPTGRWVAGVWARPGEAGRGWQPGDRGLDRAAGRSGNRGQAWTGPLADLAAQTRAYSGGWTYLLQGGVQPE